MENTKAYAFPLTESQKEIWFAAQMSDAASAAFNQSCVLELKGALDFAALSDALDVLMERHEALRTTFCAIGQEQYIHETLPLFCPVVDLTQEAGKSALIEKRLRQEVQTPFDLTKGPMIRASLLKLGDDRHDLVVTAHHLVCDGTSLNVVVEELAKNYSAGKGKSGENRTAPMQYRQFVEQQNGLRGQRRAAESYWLKQYEVRPSLLELPSDHPRPALRTFQGGGGFLHLDSKLSGEFRRLAGKNRCSLFAASLAMFYVLLHRLSGQTDIVVGVPMAARAGDGSLEMVGHCVNFLPLRMTIEGNPTFLEHLKNVRNMLLDAMDHVNYNFGSLIQKLNLPRRPTRAPLVSTMFNVDHIAEEFVMDGLEMNVKPNPYCLSNFDFSLSLEDHAGRLEARCLYSSDMFEPATIDRWLHHYQTLMQSVVADPNCRIGRLGMLTPAERSFIVRCAGTEEHMIHDLLPPELAATTQPGTPELEMYVIDRHGEPAAIGVIGELCFASLPLTSSPGLAPERLVPSPFAEHYGAALYRTGSKARLLANGDMEILEADRMTRAAGKQTTAAAAPMISRVEGVLTQIWQDVLAHDAIGRNEDFFDLGGHSLLITQIMLRVRRAFDVELTLRNFFDAPTIAELTELIEQRVVQQVWELPEQEAEQLAKGSLQAV